MTRKVFKRYCWSNFTHGLLINCNDSENQTECSPPPHITIILSVMFFWLHLVCKTVPSARCVPGRWRILSVTLEDPVLWPSGKVRKWGLSCSCKFYLHLHVIGHILPVCYCDGFMLFLKFPLFFSRLMWKYWSYTARQTRLWLFWVMRSFGKLHLLLKSSQKNILLLKCKITCNWIMSQWIQPIWYLI